MKKFRFIILFLIIVIFCYIFFYNISIPINRGLILDFEIKEGQSSNIVAHNLKSENLIRNSFIFDIYMKLSGKYKKILPGKFKLSDSMSYAQISNIIIKKQANLNFEEKEIKIIEGWNLKQIGKYLENQELCTEKEFMELSRSNNYEYDFIKQKPKSTDLEGYLFPDTYRVYKNSTCYDVINKLLNNFDKKLTKEMRADIEKQGKSVNEIITMASIVEKEVKTLEDMRIVSGIFWDRIEYGQALESCATLAYVLGEIKAQYSYEDTRVESLYNTYINKGLPPGPINNPGFNSIIASIYPEKSNYNYFLTDPKTGDTIFSKTFEEHKRNKLIYLK